MAKGGKRPGAGRKPGSPNQLTGDVKTAIAIAFEKAGGVEYLFKLSKDDPRTFCSLLGKIVPLTIGGDPTNPVQTQNSIEIKFVYPPGHPKFRADSV